MHNSGNDTFKLNYVANIAFVNPNETENES